MQKNRALYKQCNFFIISIGRSKLYGRSENSHVRQNTNLGITGIVQVLDGHFNKKYQQKIIKDNGYVNVR